MMTESSAGEFSEDAQAGAPTSPPVETPGSVGDTGAPKLPRPETIKALIEYAYAEPGRKVQISKKDLDAIKVNVDDAESEMTTLRELAKADALLQVPPKLLALVPQAGSRVDLRGRILDLGLEAMVSHPIFEARAEGLMTRGEDPAARPLTAEQVASAAQSIPAVDLGIEVVEGKESWRRPLRVNAVTAFLYVRVLRDHWSLERFLEGMTEHVWLSTGSNKMGVARQAIALGSAIQTEPLIILTRHFATALRDAALREQQLRSEATLATERASRAAVQVGDLEAKAEAERHARREIELKLGEVSNALNTERSNRVVDRSHAVDDYEVLRTQVLRKLTPQVNLLTDGLHALRNGSTEVADEFVDRVLSSIESEVDRLKNLSGGAS